MERLQADLRAYYERQAHKLLDLARGCGDPQTAKKLTEMASEYVAKLDLAPDERPAAQPDSMAH